jgi:hypothetical protein
MIMKVGLTVTTQDDATLDAVLEALEAFGKGELRDLIHDPLAEVMVDTSEGDVIWC